MTNLIDLQPFTLAEHEALAAYKAGGGPAEYLADVVIDMRERISRAEAIRKVVQFEHKVFEDDAAAPRDFWHVRAVFGEGDLVGDWVQYGELGDHRAPMSAEVRAHNENRAFNCTIDALLEIGKAYASVSA
ncbi:hypothetical protein D869_gp146 [Caulobacter phage CcrRogue]|uniref:Uncharacterized protein n=1 Tax=Caulobacter phage CcrRogue TaxID=2927986 RepID=K4JSP1_9CAUD|nr:hypothetical protein D869_gp146 [Caulobacter phage CcrRogue]AFU86768.1 hypothetical protein CcrRogue_gp286 [Caulobacter phage CcrRogue]